MSNRSLRCQRGAFSSSTARRRCWEAPQDVQWHIPISICWIETPVAVFLRPWSMTSGKFFTRWCTSGFPPVCLETLLSCLGSVETLIPLHIYMTSLVNVEYPLTKDSILLLAIWHGSLKYFGHTGLFWAMGFWWPFEIWIGKCINVSIVNCLTNKNAVCDILLSSREILAN